MSIPAIIAQRLDRDIFFVPSLFLGEETPRSVFASTEVAAAVLGEWDDTRVGRRHKMARAMLDSFSEGGYITIAENPFNKDASALLARVDPINSEIWDFRCLDPRPGIRILGCFIATDEFIALSWDYRENFDDENGWAGKIRQCQEEWRRLFGNLTPHSGDSLDAYVSYNFEAV